MYSSDLHINDRHRHRLSTKEYSGSQCQYQEKPPSIHHPHRDALIDRLNLPLRLGLGSSTGCIDISMEYLCKSLRTRRISNAFVLGEISVREG